MAIVELEKVSKRYGDVLAVQDFTLNTTDGEFVVLVGPSGCGKTTTMRMIAGLEAITAGLDQNRRAGCGWDDTQGAGCRNGVPELCVVSAHERIREHGVWPAASKGSETTD